MATRVTSATYAPIERSTSVKHPALVLTQNEHRFYFATIPIDELFPSCSIVRRDEDPKAGFQRLLNEDRANDIAKYLASGSGSIPSNIVLSAQEVANLQYNNKTKRISYRPLPRAFLVLDGQHRLWGYHKCRSRHRVPVAIYQGLTRSEEAKLFVDINTTQRGVPAALLLDIKQLAQIENQQEQSLRKIFDKLNTERASPLYGKLSAAKSVAGKISRVTFNKSVGPILHLPIISDAPPESAYRLIVNYIQAGKSTFGEDRLLRSAFFEAFFAIFDEVVRDAISKKKNAKADSIGDILLPLSKINYAGVQGRLLRNKTDILSAMQATLRQSIAISGDML